MAHRRPKARATEAKWKNRDIATRHLSVIFEGCRLRKVQETRLMNKEIRLAAFDMNCVGHIQHGMWTHPRDRSTEYNTIQYWQDLARLAERGKFDGIFLADIVGVYDVYWGGPAPSIIDAVQIPVNDPMMVVPVMATVTEHTLTGFFAGITWYGGKVQGRRVCVPPPMPAAAAPTHPRCRAASDFGSADNLPHRKLRRRDVTCAPLCDPAPGCGIDETAETTAA
jgi:hypothetical protein